MLKYIVSRVVQIPIVVLLVTVIVFGVMHLLPGDPTLTYFGQSASGLTAAETAQLRHSMGLDEPVTEQYLKWLGGVARGDFGVSDVNGTSVGAEIRTRVPVTLQIGVFGLFIAIVVGIAAGTVAATHRNSWIDRAVTVAVTMGIAVPNFWLAILLIWLFSVGLNWLPASGFVSVASSPVGAFRYSVLPATVLGLTLAAPLARYTRSSVLEVLGQDYVRTAKAKGLSRARTLSRHTLRNALLPISTIIGLQVGLVFAGSVIVETMFALPGMGRLAIDSVNGRDYTTLEAVTLLFAIAILLVNLATDISYGIIDPRIRRS